jgi:hypothetical protein
MWNYLKSYFKFCWQVTREEFPLTKGYMPMKKLVRVLWLLVTLIGALTIISFVWPVIKSHINLIGVSLLSLLSMALLILIGLIKQFHERTVLNLKTDHKARAKRILKLGEMLGQGSQLDLLIMEDIEGNKVSVKMLKAYAGLIQTALYDCYGPLGVKKFTHGNSEVIELPKEGASKDTWLYHIQLRLNELIQEDMPKSDEPARKIPDEAYMVR